MRVMRKDTLAKIVRPNMVEVDMIAGKRIDMKRGEIVEALTDKSGIGAIVDIGVIVQVPTGMTGLLGALDTGVVAEVREGLLGLLVTVIDYMIAKIVYNVVLK